MKITYVIPNVMLGGAVLVLNTVKVKNKLSDQLGYGMIEIEQALMSEPSIMNNARSNDNSDVSLQIANYKVRYVELTKPIAGAFLGGIDYELANTTDLTGSSLIMVGNTIANFISWIVGEEIIHPLCVYFNLYTVSESRNPLYRNFKTLASLGASLGTILATLDTSAIDLKLNISIYSACASFFLGIFAFAYRWYQQSFPGMAENKENIDAQVGTEGWSKYSKLALTFGTSIGQSIGGYVSYVAGYDVSTSLSNIMLYGSISAIISFISIVILVPIVNYLTRDTAETAMGILVTHNKDVFNTNYMRSGMTLGATIGSIFGGLLGPVIIAGLSPLVGIAIGAAVFAIISGIALGVYGQHLTLYLQQNWSVPVNTENSWSFASRNTSYLFSFIGTAIACVFCPGAALPQAMAIGSAISSLIGWFAGLWVIWKARQVEPDEEKTKAEYLPWTQRISTGANRGSIIGAFAGVALGLCAGGPLGLIGWIFLASSLGGILGGVTEGFADSVARQLIWQILFEDGSTPTIEVVVPDNEANFHLNYRSGCSQTAAITIDNNSASHARGACSTPTDIETSSLHHSFNRNLLFSSRSSFQEDKGVVWNNHQKC